MDDLRRISLGDVQSFYEALAENAPAIIIADKLDCNIVSKLFNESEPNIGSVLVSVVDCNTDCDSTNSKSTEHLNSFLLKIKSGNINSLYMKDFHIDKIPGVHYSVPLILEDDWLNWYWKKYRHHDDDYCFVYAGGNKTFTGIHHDVVCSYSWSVNLVGSKLWRLWPPCQTHAIRSAVNLNVYEVEMKSTASVVFTQSVGDIVFVPSGWWHTVENLGCLESADCTELNLTISLNRNWFNGISIYEVWRFLLRELNSVRQELWHLKVPDTITRFSSSRQVAMDDGDWNRQCDEVLKASASINIKMFTELIFSRAALICDVYTSNQDLSLISADFISTLCPSYDKSMIDSKDRSLFNCQRQTLLPKPVNEENLLSHYERTPFHESALHLDSICQGIAVTFPISVCDFGSCGIISITREIVHCSSLFNYLSDVLGTEKENLLYHLHAIIEGLNSVTQTAVT